MTTELEKPTKIIRIREVQLRTGLSRSSIYYAIKEKAFPAPIKLSLRASGWIESEVEAWTMGRIRHRHGGA